MPEGDYYSREYRKARRAAIATQRVCQVCGTSQDLQVHHLDADSTNHDAANLQVLCVEDHRAATNQRRHDQRHA
jgi:5-methylcytosine-specific restriction endonuclease McrA